MISLGIVTVISLGIWIGRRPVFCICIGLPAIASDLSHDAQPVSSSCVWQVGEQQATYVAMLQLHMEALRELESKTNVFPHHPSFHP